MLAYTYHGLDVSPGGFSIYIQKSYIIIMELYLCLFQNKGADFFSSIVAILRVTKLNISIQYHILYTHTHKHSVASLLNLHIVVVMWYGLGSAYSRFAFGHATNVTYPIGKKRKR